MSVPTSMHNYLRMFAGELGDRILQTYPALQKADDPLSSRLASLIRRPFPAQAVAAMGVAEKWEMDRSAAVIAECGTGKTLISLAAAHVHSAGRPFTAIVMAPGHITLKWCKEALETIPRLRVFLIDGLRDRVRSSSAPCGVNEVRLRRGQIVREGLHTALTDLRLRKNHKSARTRWQLDPRKMVAHGHEWGEMGLRSFAETYGVLERVPTIEPATTVAPKRASPRRSNESQVHRHCCSVNF